MGRVRYTSLFSSKEMRKGGITYRRIARGASASGTRGGGPSRGLSCTADRLGGGDPCFCRCLLEGSTHARRNPTPTGVAGEEFGEGWILESALTVLLLL